MHNLFLEVYTMNKYTQYVCICVLMWVEIKIKNNKWRRKTNYSYISLPAVINYSLDYVVMNAYYIMRWWCPSNGMMCSMTNAYHNEMLMFPSDPTVGDHNYHHFTNLNVTTSHVCVANCRHQCIEYHWLKCWRLHWRAHVLYLLLTVQYNHSFILMQRTQLSCWQQMQITCRIWCSL